MKKFLLLSLALTLVFTGFSQKRAFMPQELKDYAVVKPLPGHISGEFLNATGPFAKSSNSFYDETLIGNTQYDDQSNASMQNRLYLYNDGTIGAAWIFGTGAPGYTDRGTGYNYYNGTAWTGVPSSRVEDVRTGWPSYAPLGANGEIVVSHTGASGLYISKRAQKGSGSWTYTPFPGPDGHHLLWNRSITSGANHERVHIFGLTAPIAYSGTPYEGLDGALVYSLSTDGGETWEMLNQILPGMTANDYYGFSSDNYTWAEPKGDILAFVVGETWFDMFLMKSVDGGESFEKTMIWEHPYPFFSTQSPIATDTFYCADGAHSLVIDNNNMVHVVFGINRAQSDGTNTYWYPFVDGIGYWNENMPAFSNHKNALSPYGDPGSELIKDYNLIGWTQDVDGDGEITYIGYSTDNIGIYYLGISSMPQLVINDDDLYLVFSSTTETYYSGTINYRHLWLRYSTDGGATWGSFTDLTSDLIHTFDECVYPSCAANTDQYMYMLFQQDNSPGNFVWGNQHPAGDNYMVMMKVPILGTDVQQVNEPVVQVSQNFPNPFKTTSEVRVILDQPSSIILEVFDMSGNKVIETIKPLAGKGNHNLTIDASSLSPGVYFYKIITNAQSVSKKMIVE